MDNFSEFTAAEVQKLLPKDPNLRLKQYLRENVRARALNGHTTLYLDSNHIHMLAPRQNPEATMQDIQNWLVQRGFYVKKVQLTAWAISWEPTNV